MNHSKWYSAPRAALPFRAARACSSQVHAGRPALVPGQLPIYGSASWTWVDLPIRDSLREEIWESDEELLAFLEHLQAVRHSDLSGS